MRRLIGFLGFLTLCAVSFTAPQALVSTVFDKTHSTASSYVCDMTSPGCAVAFSYNRALVNGYSGGLFQVAYGDPLSPSGTFDVSAATPYADIAAHCQGANANACVMPILYDQKGGCNLNASVGLNAFQTPAPVSMSPVTGLFRFWRASSTAGIDMNPNGNFFYRYAYRYGGASNTTPCASITATGNTDITNMMVGEDGFYDQCCSSVGIGNTNPAVLVIGAGWGLGWRAPTRATLDCETYEDYVDYTSTPPALFRAMGRFYASNATNDFWINGVKEHNRTGACAYSYTDFSPTGWAGPRLGEAGLLGPDTGDDSGHEPAGKHFESAVFNYGVLDAETTNIMANQLTFYSSNRSTPTGCRGLLNLIDGEPRVTSAYLDAAGDELVVPAEHGWSFRVVNGYYMGAIMRVRNGNTNNEFDISPLAGQCDVTTALQAGNGTTGGPGCSTNNSTTPCFVVKIYDQTIQGGITVSQSTAANQPQVWFNASPNGKTAMKCDGSTQFLRSATTAPTFFGSNPAAITNTNTILASGQRLGGFTTLMGLFDTDSSDILLGWDSSANTAYMQPPSFHSGVTASATDNVWHNFIAEQDFNNVTMGVDTGTLPATVASGSVALKGRLPVGFCTVADFTRLNGYWGEVVVLAGAGGNLVSTRSNDPAYHSDQAAYW